MQTIGLIGGMSWVSTADYYRIINQQVQQTLGGSASADILLHSLNFAAIEALQRAGNWDALGAQLADSARRLEAAGAACIVICANTMHRVAPAVAAAVAVPLIHIADAVAGLLRPFGVTSLGLLGTRYTMEQPFLRERLAAHGLEVLTPAPPTRAQLHAIIYDELVHNHFSDASRAAVLAMIDTLAAQGAQWTALACTELPLLVPADATPWPTLDTTHAHASAAVAYALRGELPPTPREAPSAPPATALAQAQVLFGSALGVSLGTAIFLRPPVNANDLEADARAAVAAFARPGRAEALLTVWETVSKQPADDPLSLVTRLLLHDNFRVQLQADQLINNHDAGADAAGAVLEALFAPAAALEQRVFLYGDGEALAGLVIASRRADATIYLVSLFD